MTSAGGITEYALAGEIETLDRALRIDGDKPIERVIDHRAQMVFAAVQLGGSFLDVFQVLLKRAQHFGKFTDLVIPVRRQREVHAFAVGGLHQRVHHRVDGPDDATHDDAEAIGAQK